MSKETLPSDYEAITEAQKLINRAESTDSGSNNDSVYSRLPEGVNHPTEMYDPSPTVYSKNNRLKWLQIIEIKSPSSKSELGDERGL